MLFTRLGFTMFRLEAFQNHRPDEPPFVAVQLLRSRTTMSALANRPARRARWA